MHLLSVQSAAPSDGSEPVDAGQTPGDVVFISAADTELASLAEANRRLDSSDRFLRLARLSWFTHPFSVDLYIERTACRSRLVIVRALGGFSYWRYCLEQFALHLDQAGIPFAAIPGEDHDDAELREISSVSNQNWEKIYSLCREGGPANATFLLQLCRHLVFDEPVPPGVTPFSRCGVYWPGQHNPTLALVRKAWTAGAPVAVLVFYRALVQGGNLETVDCLIEETRRQGMNVLPFYVNSLKDQKTASLLENCLDAVRPDIILNCTGFALGAPTPDGARTPTVLDAPGRPVLQLVLASSDKATWREGSFGLTGRDIAMNVSLPEVDGRILTNAVAFKIQTRVDSRTQCPVSLHLPEAGKIARVVSLARNLTRLSRTPARDRKVALILANYPNRDGRLANGVGLDTPESVFATLEVLSNAGYALSDTPGNSSELMSELQNIPSNDVSQLTSRTVREVLPMKHYAVMFAELPEAARVQVVRRWGRAESDPFVLDDAFCLPVIRYGNVVVGIQPARGFNIDPVQTYHCPDLPPPHNYLAFYFWLRRHFAVHAIVHFGKHGNLEWLPGKALALSENCFPEISLGDIPNVYPFIVNDPGEGTQAKRRSHAVIIDHLTPPLSRAESYGEYRELEVLLDEYYEAVSVDRRRAELLCSKIVDAMSRSRLNRDVGVSESEDVSGRMQKLDAYLCELKESQIRDGLHVFGKEPDGRLERDLTVSLLRAPRHNGLKQDASLLRALATDLELPKDFDPLDCDMSATWTATQPAILLATCEDKWRSNGDTVERLELLAARLLDGEIAPPGQSTLSVMNFAESVLRPRIASCGSAEMGGLLAALDGTFTSPGPSGAPSRGRLDVLPTGRNFYSIDSRSMPTQTAWELGWRSATRLVDSFAQSRGYWPKTMAVTAWGTSNMRTGGDDIAQVLALMGARPTWDANSGRVTGTEIMPLNVLGRPRVDVTLRVSGFFRDAFPMQMDLVDKAARLVMNLDEPESDNPAAAAFNRDLPELGEDRAAFRVFGSMPGAYGAGLQALVDERNWTTRQDLGEAYIEWGAYAYGGAAAGKRDRLAFTSRLENIEAVVQNQDNREHDVLDSDDYYQFEGGMSAAVEFLAGRRPVLYHNDHSRPERPVIRTLEQEIGRVVRSRAANPKWIDGIKRHGYKGAFEIAATVDYLFAFAATTGAAKSHHFDLLYLAYIEDIDTRQFIGEANPAALREIASRFMESIERGLWHPRSNSCRGLLTELIGTTDRTATGGRIQ